MKSEWLKHAAVATAILLGTVLIGPLHAQAETSGARASADPNEVTLNFENADIEGVVKAMAEITGKNFVIDPHVKGTINIVSATPIPKSQVYDVFLSALRLQGYAAVEDRGLVKILPEADAKVHRNRSFSGLDAQGDRIQTRVFKLTHESAARLLPTLRPLIAPNNSIAAVDSSNTLVITDYASNLQRIARIIQSVDQPAASEPVMIPLHFASAIDAAQTINRLFADAAPGQTDTGSRTTVVADARSNSLLVRVADPSRLAQVRRFAAMLDTPTRDGGNIHVVYLKNAEAEKIAATLRAIYSGNTARSGATGATGATNPAGNGVGLQGTTPAAEGESEPGIIQADAATNSIIITAPDAIYNNLRAALEKLDTRRLQVYVEALVVELTASKAGEFGIQWQDLSGINRTGQQVIGGTNFGGAGQNIIGISSNPTSAGPGLNLGVMNGTVTIGGVQILNLGLLVRALQSDNNANILSTPTLLSLDNEEAKIVIGQNVPFITGQYAISGAATTPTPFQTIERKDVGLTLRIRPQISEGGQVRLQIYQEVSSIADTTNIAGVITNKRSIESTVLVNDGQIIVIGGLIQDSTGGGVSKVPLLGDIPIVGGLFRQNTRSRTKTNLMVFLRPTVLRDAQRADTVTSDRYDYIRGEQIQEKLPPHPVFRNYDAPILPASPHKVTPTPKSGH
jgi:general secretion pathway protein D